MRRLALALLLTAPACGRYGFADDPRVDGAPPGDGTATPATLTCYRAARAAIVPSEVSILRAVGTASGFDVFTIDPGHSVHGFAYEFTGPGSDGLKPRAENALFRSDSAGTIGAAAVGDDVLLAQVYGVPDAVGTSLTPLGEHLAPGGEVSARDGQYGTAVPLARSGISDQIGYLTTQASGELDARAVSTLGADLSGGAKIADSSEQIGEPAFAPGGHGYIATWISNAGTPNVTRAALVDESFSLVGDPVTVGDGVAHPDDEGAARAAWAPDSDTYLVTWYQKTMGSGGGDRIWFAILDKDLGSLVPPTILSDDGVSPKVVSDGADFVVVWESNQQQAHLGAAHVAHDGAVHQVVVESTGGTEADWSLAVHAGQPALVWAEAGGTGGNAKALWFDPLCL